MKEIRLHGRGGQGVVVAARILASAFVREGKYGMAFPKFGFERRGAPVVAFARFDEKPIREKTQVYEPDCLIVADPRLIRSVDIFAGIRPDGILVMNAVEPVRERWHENLVAVVTVDATDIGLKEIGTPITNTCMLGAFVRATGWLELDSLLSSLGEYFDGSLLEKNKKCVQRGYEESTALGLRRS